MQLPYTPFTDDMMPPSLDQIRELRGCGTLVSYMDGEPTICRSITEWIEQVRGLGLDFSLHDQRVSHDRGDGPAVRRGGAF